MKTLVTELEGLSSFENPEKVGLLTFKVLPYSSVPDRPELGYYTGVAAKESAVKLRVSDGNIYNGSGVSQGKEMTISTSLTYIYLPNLNCDLYVEKYNIGRMSTSRNAILGNISSTYYSTLMYIDGGGWKGKIGDANPDTITSFDLNGNNFVACSLDDFIPFKKLTVLRVPIPFTGGNIEDLGGHTELVTLSVTHCVGDVSKLAAAQVANGRVNCTGINCIELGTNTYHNSVTFNGSVFVTSGVVTLKWKPTTSSASGAVTDVQLSSTAITIDADGNKVADATPW